MKTMKRTRKEKMIAIILTIAMALAFVPTAAFADGESNGGSEPAKTESVSENHSSSGNSGSSGGSSHSSNNAGSAGSSASSSSSSSSSSNSGSSSSGSSDSSSSQKSSSDNGSQTKSESTESKSESTETKNESTETKSENTETKSESTDKTSESGNSEAKDETTAKAGESNGTTEDKTSEAEKKTESKTDTDTNEETQDESKQDNENAGSTDGKDAAGNEKASADEEEAENTGSDDLAEPAKPADIDGELTNDKIKQYNAEVDEYNKKVDEYNKAVDDKYEADLERVKKENEAIEEHNQNEKAKAEEIAKKNAEIQAQYNEDLVQYQKDKDVADRIAAQNNGMTVEEYNRIITEVYNKPAEKAVAKNAESGKFEIEKTYEIQEAEVKSGRTFKVNIEHNFQTFDTKTYISDTLYSYKTTIELDENDILTLHSIAASNNAGKYDENNSRDTRFYLNTDEAHTMGYWGAWGTVLMDNAKYHYRDDINGDYYTISYKDGANHYGDDTTVDITYNYVWSQLRTAKTYNVPKEPTLELINYTPDFKEKLADPTRKDYLTYLDPKDLLPEPNPTDPEPTVGPTDPTDPVYPPLDPQEPTDDPEDPETPVTPEKPDTPDKPEKPDTPAKKPAQDKPSGNNGTGNNGTTVNRTNANPGQTTANTLITANETPLTASTDMGTMTTELTDPETPLAAFHGAWALINLIAAVLTAVISVLLLGFWFISRREEREENEAGEEYAAEKTNRKPILRILGIIPAITAIIVFILTEDLTLPMQLVDKYTILMILILAVEIAIACLCKKTRDDEEDEEIQA